jgi:hypothetical protein
MQSAVQPDFNAFVLHALTVKPGRDPGIPQHLNAAVL